MRTPPVGARWMRLSQIDPAGGPAVVIGAGGAARSTVWALADLGATGVVVLNRTVERAQALVTSLQPHLKSIDLMWGNITEAAEPGSAAMACCGQRDVARAPRVGARSPALAGTVVTAWPSSWPTTHP